MGLLGLFKKGVDVIDQVVEDKDKANELKTDLAKSTASLMLTGHGASVTKITICGLITIIVLIGCGVFIFKPDSMNDFKDFALAITPLIGILIGAYGTGTTIQKVMKK